MSNMTQETTINQRAQGLHTRADQHDQDAQWYQDRADWYDRAASEARNREDDPNSQEIADGHARTADECNQEADKLRRSAAILRDKADSDA